MVRKQKKNDRMSRDSECVIWNYCRVLYGLLDFEVSDLLATDDMFWSHPSCRVRKIIQKKNATREVDAIFTVQADVEIPTRGFHDVIKVILLEFMERILRIIAVFVKCIEIVGIVFFYLLNVYTIKLRLSQLYFFLKNQKQKTYTYLFAVWYSFMNQKKYRGWVKSP